MLEHTYTPTTGADMLGYGEGPSSLPFQRQAAAPDEWLGAIRPEERRMAQQVCDARIRSLLKRIRSPAMSSDDALRDIMMNWWTSLCVPPDDEVIERIMRKVVCCENREHASAVCCVVSEAVHAIVQVRDGNRRAVLPILCFLHNDASRSFQIVLRMLSKVAQRPSQSGWGPSYYALEGGTPQLAQHTGDAGSYGQETQYSTLAGLEGLLADA